MTVDTDVSKAAGAPVRAHRRGLAPHLLCYNYNVWEEVTLSEITNTFITLEEMEAATNRLLETAAAA